VAALSAQTAPAVRAPERSDARAASAARILTDIEYLADDAREGAA